MALLKKAVVSSGVEVEYWRITTVEYDAANQIGNVRLSIYLNKEMRDLGKTPVDSAVIQLKDWLKIEVENSGIIQATYQKIKTLPEMRDALDC